MFMEDLMKPRYKVIADMPFNHFSVGDIITDINKIEGYQFEKYPHLFKPLQWWEERRIEDMPEYVKYLGHYYPVKWSHNAANRLVISIVKGDGGNTFEMDYCLQDITPATKEEYELTKNGLLDGK